MRPILIAFLCCAWFFGRTQTFIDTFTTFTPSPREVACMQHFEPCLEDAGIYNTYVLAKLAETMYPERLDYMFRFFQNDRKPIDSIPSTAWLKQHAIINDTNFEQAFTRRFEHYFVPEDRATFKYLQATYFLDPWIGKQKKNGFDPEVVVISTERYIIVAYRGTDMMEDERWGEWIGTDFNFLKAQSNRYFGRAKIHRGFLHSFELIQPKLLRYLKSIDAGDKPIWVTGHSLGGAMAILTGLDLFKRGYCIQGVKAFGTPNALGDQHFVNQLPEAFLAKIERYEFCMDPVPILWSPGYVSFGKRNWISDEYALFLDIPHRSFQLKDNDLAHLEANLQSDLKLALHKNIFALPYEFHHHNPQWYVKSLILHLSDQQRQNCPEIDDSFPFIYYGWEKAR